VPASLARWDVSRMSVRAIRCIYSVSLIHPRLAQNRAEPPTPIPSRWAVLRGASKVGAAAAWSLGFFAAAVAAGLVVERVRNPRK
jgi:hypothetical protein